MFDIVKQAISGFSHDKCARIAAALAYYTAFALAPMLLLVISLCQLVFTPEDVRGQVEDEIANVVGADGAEQIKTMLDTNQAEEKRGTFSTILSGAAMLLGATGLFAQLQGAMNEVWEVQPNPNQGGIKTFLAKRLVSIGMLLTIAFLLMVSMTASTALHAFDASLDRWLPGHFGSEVLGVANYFLSCAMMTILFAFMFKYLPDAKIPWGNVWVGAAFTAVLFLIGKFAIAIYVGNKGVEDAYGAAGSLVVILMWVYYSALIFLFGAEFTQAWARKRGGGIVPARGAVRVVKHAETVT